MASDISEPIGSLWHQPTAPTGNQAKRVLEVIRYSGHTDIRDWPPGFRLAARIADLRSLGWPIEKRMIVLPGGTRVAEYRL